HRALETLTLDKRVLATKKELEVKFGELAYEGYWFSPLKDAINSFIDTTQEYVNGVVKVRLYKGMAVVRGMKSGKSIYSETLATYSENDAFDHSAAVGFIKIWGLPIKTWRQVHESKEAIEIPAQ
ncbi:MAG: argininosuccinate synthase, partial [Synergistetes bacterium HGW-Synergistetes-2]